MAYNGRNFKENVTGDRRGHNGGQCSLNDIAGVWENLQTTEELCKTVTVIHFMNLE